jgi:hypothetical protein
VTSVGAAGLLGPGAPTVGAPPTPAASTVKMSRSYRTNLA